MDRLVKGKKTNVLLVKDDVGVAKTGTRPLPPDGFAFGKKDISDPEGAAASNSIPINLGQLRDHGKFMKEARKQNQKEISRNLTRCRSKTRSLMPE